MKNSLKDKVVLITGASKGIGFSGAKLFLQQGSKMAFCGLPEKVAEILVNIATTLPEARMCFEV